MINRIISLFALVSVAIISCDVLETEPQTSIDSNGVIENGTSAEAVLAGAYSDLQDDDLYGIEFPLNIDLIADNAVFQGFFDSQLELDQKAVPITNLWISSAWVDFYRVINTSNLLIDEIPDLNDDAFADSNLVLGEAHALRALAYFDLLRVFGEHYDVNSTFGLPLIVDPIPDNDFNQIPDLERSTVQQTYNLILEDLDEAIDLMAGYVDNERLTYWGAVALRARVNLYAGNYTAAFNDADDVIQNGGFTLLQDLDEVYLTLEPSDESIFDLVFNEQDQSSYNDFIQGRDEYNVDPDLLASLEPGDERANFFYQSRNRDRSGKYQDANNANNAKVIRLAEMYLIRSEAAVFQTITPNPNAGLADLNTIRNRADLGDAGPFLTVDDYVDALLQERRIEFNYEGHRFFDLVRFDRINSVLGMDDFRKVFPIPRDELLVSENLVQNPVYASE